MKTAVEMFADVTNKIIDTKGSTADLTKQWEERQIEKYGTISTIETEMFRNCVEVAFLYLRDWLGDYCEKEGRLL